MLALAEALHHPDSISARALITALLALDAEIKLTVDDKARILPLSGFLSYRSRLPMATFPLDTVRLPQLNPGGHYFFTQIGGDRFLAIRLDRYLLQQLLTK